MGTTDSFVVKDSGKRETFGSGMVRDTTEGKLVWHSVAEGPMLRRWVCRLAGGKLKYPDPSPGVGNWTLATGNEEYQRFRESAFRHFMEWFYGNVDEDHAAAVFFNINGAEYVKDKMNQKPSLPLPISHRLPGLPAGWIG